VIGSHDQRVKRNISCRGRRIVGGVERELDFHPYSGRGDVGLTGGTRGANGKMLMVIGRGGVSGVDCRRGVCGEKF